jgi:hypothetical protein
MLIFLNVQNKKCGKFKNLYEFRPHEKYWQMYLSL